PVPVKSLASWLVFALALPLLPACSSSSSSPVRPSPPDLSGAWSGEVTLTDFDGGECLATTFHDIAGLPGEFHAALTQSGSHVTATMDFDPTGATCTFEGALDGSQLVMTTAACTGAKILAVACQSGEMRGLLPESETLVATADATRIDGQA